MPIFTSLYFIFSSFLFNNFFSPSLPSDHPSFLSSSLSSFCPSFLPMSGIRVDVTLNDGSTRSALLTHNDLETCVGDAIAAFATQMVFPDARQGVSFSPGVFFPEEVSNPSFSRNILQDVSQDAITATYF